MYSRCDPGGQVDGDVDNSVDDMKRMSNNHQLLLDNWFLQNIQYSIWYCRNIIFAAIIRQ